MSSAGTFSSKLLPDMLNCEKFTEDGRELLQNFHDRAAVRLAQIFASEQHRNTLMATIHSLQEEDLELIAKPEDGISTLQSLLQDVLDDLRVHKKSLKKGEDAVINALYICILDMLKDKLVPEDFKYPTRDDFMRVYGEKFAAESDREKTILWQSANWMCILFKMITAKKNTGLTIEVIPKVVEGWNAKYITGGGMKPATANRVYLLHQEGKVPFKHRGKSSKKTEHDDDYSVEHQSERKGKRGRPPIPSSQKKKDRSMSMSSSSSPANTRSKRQRIYDDNTSSGGESDNNLTPDHQHNNHHHDLSILAEAASRTAKNENIETEKYLPLPPLMASTSLTWLDDDNLLEDELLFPDTPVTPGRQLYAIPDKNVEDVEPISAPTRISAMSSSATSSESEALGSGLSTSILRPTLCTRQVSMGLGFNFSRPELNREQSWTIYEPDSSSSKNEPIGEEPMQTASSSAYTNSNSTIDNATTNNSNNNTSNNNTGGYYGANSFLGSSHTNKDDYDDESIGFPDFSNADPDDPSPRSSVMRYMKSD